MTEFTEIRYNPLWPSPRPQTYLIDPVAFGAALVAAPIVVTLWSFWFFLIPVAALIMGGPIYLTIATPVLLVWLRRHPPHAGAIALLALGAVVAMVLAGAGYAMTNGRVGDLEVIYLYGIFGVIFGPLWGAQFAALYRIFRRDDYAQNLS